MRTKLDKKGIKLTIILLSIVGVIVILYFWAQYGKSNFPKSVIIFIAGFLGVLAVRIPLKLLFELIIKLIKK
ncbi:hypothetical protein D1614_17840 [Maribellus luteus]|uniref:Uncharacterized protein n=1 Tax=Maribellus luteus TaxID=2305463 RepID=A0A399SWX3_9BACT|nr:hypothetical protein [Maribellus luteus]RIJ46537.1 hypothetical protein D1614_17840 [Maribellus luteus]